MDGRSPLEPSPGRCSTKLGGLARCEDGAAILEFALALPILLALIGGAFEIGRAVLIRETMIEAVRGGARYLARVPDPTCQVTCTSGATHAITMTTDEILLNASLPASALSVTARGDPASETVSMRADVKLGVDLLRFVGLGPVLTLEASHQERRIVE